MGCFKARLLLLILFAISARGQRPASLVFSPLPPFTPSSLLVNDGRAHALFDGSKGQIVIVLPGEQPGTPSRAVRYDIANRVKPIISGAVTPLQTDGYLYSYSISDDLSSIQRSLRISLLLPDHDTSLTRADTTAWQLAMSNTAVPDRTSTAPLAHMRSVTWTDSDSSTAKIIGVNLKLISRYLPGVCEMSIAGQVSSPLTDQTLLSLPPEIAGDVQRAMSPGIGTVTRWVVCPLFRQDAQKAVIASNYHLGIQHLVRRGDLNGASDYVQKLSAYLSTFLSAGGVGTLAVPAFEPVTDLEKQVQNAIAISLK
jgi:hypothetical protein